VLPSTVFLDRDGVLNRRAAEGDYIKTPGELALLERAAEGVRLLNERGILVVVVTNQRGIALRRLSAGDLDQIHAALRARLAEGGAWLDGIYHCPHAIASCDCRKPGIGLFVQAKRDHPEIDFTRSAVIGDSPSDMAAARRIGARGILISGGRDPQRSLESDQRPLTLDFAVSLLDAARLLVDGDRSVINDLR
jgi:D-glycero-D-manno-heptose 1,7-bisphosphate phosphatase